MRSDRLEVEGASICTDNNDEESAILVLHKWQTSAAYRTDGITDRAESKKSVSSLNRDLRKRSLP